MSCDVCAEESRGGGHLIPLEFELQTFMSHHIGSGWESNPGLLEEQPGLFTVELSNSIKAQLRTYSRFIEPTPLFVMFNSHLSPP